MGDKRFIRDVLHGDILLPESARIIVDTRTFQRLRYIQQLASCHYVFPSATHSRFSHSIGAFHLATRLIEHLREEHPNRISDEDAHLVPLAALLHDVGHPPFSHMLETPEVFATYRTHEEWGRLIMQDPDCDLSQTLQDLLGDSLPRLFAILDGSADEPFLHEIVSSQLDVDRLDYLQRDMLVTGAAVGGFDLERIMRSMHISDAGHLVVRQDRVSAVEGYLATRLHMYELVYFHKLNVLTQAYYLGVLKRAKELHENGDLVLSLKMRQMLSNRQLTPYHYSQLTDAFIVADVFGWADHRDPILSGYARRLSSRDDFHKRIRIRLTSSQVDRLVPALSNLVENAGFDPVHDLLYAPMRRGGYMPYSEGIMLDDGSDIMDSSALIESMAEKSDPSMVFVPREIREECEKLVEQLL